MKVALIQMKSGLDKSRNLANAVMWVRRAIAHDAQFILLPEMFIFGGNLKQEKISLVAEEISGSMVKTFMDLSRRYKVYLLLGSILEKSKQGAKGYNTSVLLDSYGRVSGVYRKKHLFSARIKKHTIDESRYFLPGRENIVRKIKNFHVGLSVCFDLRFPSMYQAYKNMGTDILCVPSAFTQETGQAHWEVLLRARAIEGLCYVLAPNQVGYDSAGVKRYGHSMIIDPWGKILAEASGNKEEIIYAHLDKQKIIEKRKLLVSVMKEER